jgi:thiopeptide-type bacteriocin biosynthesis protein
VQVDLFKPSESLTLEEDLVIRIARCAEAIWHLNPPPTTLLTNFVERFRKRYDSQSVRLVDALDEEHGIGFANPGTDESPLLFGLRREPKASAGNTTFGRFESILMVKLIETLRRGEDEIALSSEDIPSIPPDRLKPPESFTVQLSLETNGAGNKPQAIVRFFPITATSLFGRFCHGDEKLRQNLVDLAKREEEISADAVIAEIVHLPRGRTGNVIARPSFSEYEITYLGSSGLAIEKQIRVEDLILVLEGDELKLFSERLKRRVIPRLSCAHSFSAKGSLNTYHFLAALQSQNTTMVSSIWPAALRLLPYLPRIRFQDLIISRARWRLDEKDINQISKISKGERASALLERLRSLGVPEVCALQQGDNLLTVDLRCELSVENLLSLLTLENSAVFEEVLDDSKKGVVFGESEPFAHEIIIPFIRQTNVQEVLREQIWRENTRQKQFAVRSFSLGSEWLYAKIYCGTTTADRILCEQLAPLVMQFKSSNELEKWFFIRYGDPEKHLRIRMNGEPRFLTEVLLPALHNKLSSLQSEGVISGVQYDTYEREVERYCGPEGIEYCEEIFDADSDAVVAFLNGAGANAYERRVEFVIMGVAQYFDDLGITVEKRTQILINLVSWFSKEHSVDRDYDIRLGNKYRALSRDLVQWLDCSASRENSHTKLARKVLSKRSDQIYEAVSALRRISSERTIESVAPSIIHMFVNRVISSAQRNHELVIYDLLRRHYQSQTAQLANAPKGRKYAN